MSHAIRSVASLSEAWLLALKKAAHQPEGRMVHQVLTVERPGSEISHIRERVDAMLINAGKPGIDTVAQTIFPWDLYDDPQLTWCPYLAQHLGVTIDQAAHGLYQRYLDILPVLLSDRANRSGTYFSRIINWPGGTTEGVNQLRLRICGLRREHSLGRSTNNTLDIDLSADCMTSASSTGGVQVYAATDRRMRGFPCLVHISLTLYKRTLHCTAVYRHHYLMSKAYGNLVGLSRLMRFLCQQTGFELGELVVHATMADAEPALNPKAFICDLQQLSLFKSGCDHR